MTTPILLHQPGTMTPIRFHNPDEAEILLNGARRLVTDTEEQLKALDDESLPNLEAVHDAATRAHKDAMAASAKDREDEGKAQKAAARGIFAQHATRDFDEAKAKRAALLEDLKRYKSLVVLRENELERETLGFNLTRGDLASERRLLRSNAALLIVKSVTTVLEQLQALRDLDSQENAEVKRYHQLGGEAALYQRDGCEAQGKIMMAGDDAEGCFHGDNPNTLRFYLDPPISASDPHMNIFHNARGIIDWLLTSFETANHLRKSGSPALEAHRNRLGQLGTLLEKCRNRVEFVHGEKARIAAEEADRQEVAQTAHKARQSAKDQAALAAENRPWLTGSFAHRPLPPTPAPTTPTQSLRGASLPSSVFDDTGPGPKAPDTTVG